MGEQLILVNARLFPPLSPLAVFTLIVLLNTPVTGGTNDSMKD